MFSCKQIAGLLVTQSKQLVIKISTRNVQVSLIGAAGEVGANVALLLKQNFKIRRLQLYDDDEKVKGSATELSHIPGGPLVNAYSGETGLVASIRGSDMVVMVQRVPRRPGYLREQMLSANAPAVQRLCRAIADGNPDTFLAIATSPINCIVPFASALLYKYGCYNPFRVFGITHLDVARSRTYAAKALNTSARNLHLPVIGGHSDETIIPLFSNLSPTEYCVDPCQANTLTRLVRKSGTEVLFQKQGNEAATLAVAWSINEFVDILIDAIRGGEVLANCYTANPHFGTRFFSGPTTVSQCGIVHACHDFKLSDFETFLLNTSLPIINRDVNLGEEYIRLVDSALKT